MCKIRTLNQAISELKQNDPNCCLTLSALRRMIRNKKIPYTKSGVKYLVDIEMLPSILFEDTLKKGGKPIYEIN